MASNVSPQGGAAEPRLLRTPAIHGGTLVFSYAGDLWVARAGSEEAARRLTDHPGTELWPRISPDGRLVAFAGGYHAPNQLYVVPLEGGEPRRLSYGSAAEPLGWTPDGKIAYRSREGVSFPEVHRLWFVRPEGGLPDWTPVAEIGEASFFSDGRTIAYTRDLYRQYLGTRFYGGGRQGRIGLFDLAKNAHRELRIRGGAYSPLALGRSVYFVSEKGGLRQNLYRYDLDRRRETRLTRFEDADIRWPSTDGRRIVWERDGYLELFDPVSGKVERQRPRLPVERVRPVPREERVGREIGHVALADDGRLALEARGELFVLSGADVQNLTRSSGARERVPHWSPDGRSLAYLSDASGEWEVYLLRGSGATEQLTHARGVPFNGLRWSRDGRFLSLTTLTNELYVLELSSGRLTRVPNPKGELAAMDWSPESRWLVFTYALVQDTPVPLGSTPLGSIYFYEVPTGRLRQVTSGYYDSQVAFDRSGRYLYVQSARTLNPGFGTFEYSLGVTRTDRIYLLPLSARTPNPLRPSQERREGGESIASDIDFEGLLARALPLPMEAGDYPAIFGAENGVLFLSRAQGSGEVSLGRFDLASGKAETILRGSLKAGVRLGSAISLSPNQRRVAMLTGEGPAVVELKAGAEISSGKVGTDKLAATIDPGAEWRQIFWEAWRFYRDTFYDPNLRGVDWPAVGRRYATYLPSLTTRRDLSYVLLQMVGELGTSHSFVGDPRPMPTTSPEQPGYLGADLEEAQGHVRIRKIYRGRNYDESRQGPLGEPGVEVQEGEFLLAVDGQAVSARVNPAALLVGKAGKYVTLTVNARPSSAGARHVRVRAIEDERNLRYADWVEANRRYVLEASGGRIGYLHFPDTWSGGATELVRGFYGQTHLDALLLDDRFNMGGLAQPFIVPTLSRRSFTGSFQRNGPLWYDTYAHEGPKAMLINGYAGSGGDLLPWMFRRAGLGKLIGERTAGMFTGYFERLTFVDGGSISAPQLGYFDPKTGEILPENRGTEPDIEVHLRPDLLAQGRDPQLEAAVRHLIAELRGVRPRPRPAAIPPLRGSR